MRGKSPPMATQSRHVQLRSPRTRTQSQRISRTVGKCPLLPRVRHSRDAANDGLPSRITSSDAATSAIPKTVHEEQAASHNSRTRCATACSYVMDCAKPIIRDRHENLLHKSKMLFVFHCFLQPNRGWGLRFAHDQFLSHAQGLFIIVRGHFGIPQRALVACSSPTAPHGEMRFEASAVRVSAIG